MSASTSNVLISAKNVKKDFERGGITHALKGVSIDIHDGEFVLIKGESGSGKTTLLNVLSGLDDATEGEIVYRGISDESPVKGRSKKGDRSGEMSAKKRTELLRKVGIIFQNAQHSLIHYLDASDNVAKGVEPIGVSQREARQMSVDALESVGLADRLFHIPSELSGGECQRVCVARAIVKNPSVIFADEPTGNLDSENSAKILDILDDLHKKGKTIIMVTHSEKIDTIGKRVIMMKDGMIESIK